MARNAKGVYIHPSVTGAKMLSVSDFKAKQILFLVTKNGEKL